jgi:hypothetical protein
VTIENSVSTVVETEEALAVKVVEVLAPRLLLVIDTAPTLKELTGILEDFRCGLRYAARMRCDVLRQSIQCITEETE